MDRRDSFDSSDPDDILDTLDAIVIQQEISLGDVRDETMDDMVNSQELISGQIHDPEDITDRQSPMERDDEEEEIDSVLVKDLMEYDMPDNVNKESIASASDSEEEHEVFADPKLPQKNIGQSRIMDPESMKSVGQSGPWESPKSGGHLGSWDPESPNSSGRPSAWNQESSQRDTVSSYKSGSPGSKRKEHPQSLESPTDDLSQSKAPRKESSSGKDGSSGKYFMRAARQEDPLHFIHRIHLKSNDKEDTETEDLVAMIRSFSTSDQEDTEESSWQKRRSILTAAMVKQYETSMPEEEYGQFDQGATDDSDFVHIGAKDREEWLRNMTQEEHIVSQGESRVNTDTNHPLTDLSWSHDPMSNGSCDAVPVTEIHDIEPDLPRSDIDAYLDLPDDGGHDDNVLDRHRDYSVEGQGHMFTGRDQFEQAAEPVSPLSPTSPIRKQPVGAVTGTESLSLKEELNDRKKKKVPTATLR